MNTNMRVANLRNALIAASVSSILLAACAAAPVKPDGAAEARNNLIQLQSDPNLATRAPVALAAAEAAVRTAEQAQPDKELAAHRVYLANRQVDTARADAQTRFEEDQRVTLSAQRESARLNARTREADAAKAQAVAAQAEGAAQKSQADSARAEAQTANTAAGVAALSSAQRDADYQRQIEALQAKVTDRGLVLTLGDVLFSTGNADLKSGSSGNLNKLVAFLGKYPDRTAAIEGYTDSVGSEEYNQRLSERRADSVRSYLIGQGVDSARLSTSGKGERSPVAGNDTSEGRQQNRRVEVIINNPATALR
jgi:outer membrane protein OmpA-like peptidoglycan-associated protein